MVTIIAGTNRARLLQISHISYDFYPGGRHEMINEINQRVLGKPA